MGCIVAVYFKYLLDINFNEFRLKTIQNIIQFNLLYLYIEYNFIQQILNLYYNKNIN